MSITEVIIQDLLERMPGYNAYHVNCDRYGVSKTRSKTEQTLVFVHSSNGGSGLILNLSIDEPEMTIAATCFPSGQYKEADLADPAAFDELFRMIDAELKKLPSSGSSSPSIPRPNLVAKSL